MAAFVEIGPFWGLLTLSATAPSARDRSIAPPAYVRPARPRLVGRWLSDPGGHLVCRWAAATNAAPPDEFPKRAA
jgi:hypothetical protein